MSGFRDTVNNICNHKTFRKILLSYRVLFIPAGLAAVLYFSEPKLFWYAFAVSAFGELIQLWCFASLDKKSELAFNGLYKYTRNPMYLGRFFIVLGYFMLLKPPYVFIMIPLIVIVYWMYMWHRVQREEKTLKKILGDPYIDYCKKVNRFMPSSKGMPDGKIAIWRWKLFNQNHGGINLVGMLLSYIAIYGWFVWFSAHK